MPVLLKCVYSSFLAMAVCSPKPIDLKCVEVEFELLLSQKSIKTPSEIATLAVNNCSLNASGCCAWHGGVASFDQEQGVFICNDGTESESCGR